ncbi:hypothetical protein VNO77_09676 [Canavalia gladiata]|uniref:Uncharacterized protein n=1 Tax=Canavalia gladiata TaxID=3824 RepID=A0AAN9MEX5_CANGL
MTVFHLSAFVAFTCKVARRHCATDIRANNGGVVVVSARTVVQIHLRIVYLDIVFLHGFRWKNVEQFFHADIALPFYP